ncbi:MAG: hypothetical protein F6K56_35250 [Moorea sp. SIO3G5]|nr:hypothetical protein [Moorena sp. SIO3G5]
MGIKNLELRIENLEFRIGNRESGIPHSPFDPKCKNLLPTPYSRLPTPYSLCYHLNLLLEFSHEPPIQFPNRSRTSVYLQPHH